MATLMFLDTEGSNDPTKAAMPFLRETGALEAGIDVEIFLLSEAKLPLKRRRPWPSGPSADSRCGS